MRLVVVTLSLAAVMVSAAVTSGALAQRGGAASENPWSPEHVDGLPFNVRQHVEGHARDCGNRAAAAHYFSVSIEASGRRFYSQHFEEFYCSRPSAVCRPEGCLHEVFLDQGRRQYQVFSIYARDITLTNEGGVAGIEVVTDAGMRRLTWNGRRFIVDDRRR